MCSITDSTVRARLLREPNLDLQKAISICQAAESTNDTIKELGVAQDQTVHAVHSKPKKFNVVNKKSSRNNI